jgi:hypothetical protein
MANGWDTIIQALNNYGDQTGWNTRNKLTPVDWGATLSKLFKRKDTIPVMNGTQTEPVNNMTATDQRMLQSVGVNVPGMNGPASPDAQTTQNLRSVGLTIPEVTGSFTPTGSQTMPLNGPAQPDIRSQYFQNNAYAGYLPTGKEILTRQVSPELMNLMQGWEKDQQSNDLGQRIQQAQLENLTRKGEVDPLDQEKKRAEIAKLIRDANAPYSTGSGQKEKTFVDKMNTAYDDFRLGSSNYYKQNEKPVPDVVSWIRSNYGENAARQYKAEVTGDKKQLEIPTTASKLGISNYKPSKNYTAEEFWQVDKDVQSQKSIKKVVDNVIARMQKGEDVPDGYVQALAARMFPKSSNPLNDFKNKYHAQFYAQN